MHAKPKPSKSYHGPPPAKRAKRELPPRPATTRTLRKSGTAPLCPTTAQESQIDASESILPGSPAKTGSVTVTGSPGLVVVPIEHFDQIPGDNREQGGDESEGEGTVIVQDAELARTESSKRSRRDNR